MIELNEQAVAQLKFCLVEIEKHELVAQMFRERLSHVVQFHTGVDITKGNWNLDVDKGVISPQMNPKDN